MFLLGFDFCALNDLDSNERKQVCDVNIKLFSQTWLIYWVMLVSLFIDKLLQILLLIRGSCHDNMKCWFAYHHFQLICLSNMIGSLVVTTIFNNVSVISQLSVLLVEKTGVPGENHWPASGHWKSLLHSAVLSTPHHERNSNPQC